MMETVGWGAAGLYPEQSSADLIRQRSKGFGGTRDRRFMAKNWIWLFGFADLHDRATDKVCEPVSFY